MDWLVRGLVGVLVVMLVMVAPARAATVTWASVPDEVAARLAEGTTKLRPQDWKSGDKLWVMPEACVPHDEVIAPACPGPRHARDEKRSGGGAEEMVNDLKEKVSRTGQKAIHFVGWRQA